MAVTQLSLYKDAITLIGGRRLSALTEERKSRRVLDDAWDEGRLIDEALEAGQWAFACRTTRLDYDPSISPNFGYVHAFEKPIDYIQTVSVCSDEYFNSAITQFADETGYWWADLDELYVKYTSNDSSYGKDFTKWPPSFKAYFVALLASRAVFQLTHSETRERMVEAKLERARIKAIGKDGLKKPASFFPVGSFQAARMGNYSKSYDRA